MPSQSSPAGRLKPAAQVVADIIKEAEAVLTRPPLAQDGRA
ncbi:MAG: hypothetical protein ABSA52_19080 [Candidatus Binatia bacterium]